MKINIKAIFTLLVFIYPLPSLSDVTKGYDIGVYYFPGWKDDERGLASNRPWDSIKKFPDREPFQGWYQEGRVEVIEQQLDWMSKYGIDYVVFDWYWDGLPFAEHALASYFLARNRDKVKFSLLWANHSIHPRSIDDFDKMVSYWVKYYFQRPEFLKINGAPVVFIFSQESLRENAKKMGSTTSILLKRAREIAKRYGYDDIFFVGSSEAVDYWVKNYGPKAGYSAFSTYNYHRGFSGRYIPEKRYSHSFLELDLAYQESWDWILENSHLPYILPVTAGWDKRPWGGSKDPDHDRSSSTVETFKAHISAAKLRIDQHPVKTMNMMVICCWNEYGEGSYIEPTKTFGFGYLEALRDTFGE